MVLSLRPSMANLVFPILFRRSPPKMGRVHASFVPFPARVRGLVGRRRWRTVHPLTNVPRSDDWPAADANHRVTVGAREWPREAVVPRVRKDYALNELQ